MNKKASATEILARSQATVEHPSALDDLWEAWASHRDNLLKRCTRKLSGDVPDAEDALGDALLRAAAFFKDGKSSEIRDRRAWISRLAHNSCVDFIRVRASQRRWDTEIMVMEDVSPVSSAPIFTPEEAVLASEAMHLFRQAFDDLSDPLKATVSLRFIEGLPYSEVAGRLRISGSTARKRIQLARERLRGHCSVAL